MASPNFGDVVKALEICVWIKRNCFDPSCHAGDRYAEFKKDITDLHRRLQQFRETFETALDHTQDANSFKKEAHELIGDFEFTLQQCQALLQKYVKLDHGRSTFLDNAFWHASAQSKVNELRDRIQSHTYMIGLIIDPVQLQISSRTLENTEFIIQLLTQPQKFVRNTPLPDITRGVDALLQDAAKRGLSFEGVGTMQIPLKEGINALSLHYRQSTSQSTVSNQSVDQYLSLLKAHWLLQNLIMSKEFDSLRPGHLYRRLLMQLEQGIAVEYAREDFARLSENDICERNDLNFAIWPEKKVKEQPKKADSTEPGETALTKLALVPELPNQKEELFIFKVDDTALRTVHSVTPFDQAYRPRDTVRYVDLHSGGLVPLYFINKSERKWNFYIIYENRMIHAYELQSRKDALDLQFTFTGYKTVAYSEGASLTVTYRQSHRAWSALLRDRQHTEGGEIQLLQWPCEENSQETSLSPRTSPSGSEKHSRRSSSGFSLATQSFTDLDPSVVTVLQDNGRELVMSRLPPPPLLMVFTNNHGVHTMWQTDLSELEFVEFHGTGPTTTLQHRHGKKFTIWKLSAEEPELKAWDLCSLIPSNAGKVRGGPLVESLDCTWLALNFPDVEKKNKFKLDAVNVLHRRVQLLAQRVISRERARTSAERPHVKNLREGPGL